MATACMLMSIAFSICVISEGGFIVNQRSFVRENGNVLLQETPATTEVARSVLVTNSHTAFAPTQDELDVAVASQNRLKKKTRKSHGNRHSKYNSKDFMWNHCADETTPTKVTLTKNLKGVMCPREYPTSTCCPKHDLTVDLLRSKIAEQVSNVRCVKLLKKLRCAHCSPRSWWLFHAPDQHRLPHKRIIPIMCPRFCKKFHSACRDSIAGLQTDHFCEYHTSKEEGPCFPDYKIRRGTID